MKRILPIIFAAFSIPAAAQTVCTGGFAGTYPCSNVDLMARVDFTQMGGTFGTEGSSCWGWTDPLNGKEYAIMGCSTHTAFVDITNPAVPVYKGKLNATNNGSSLWREMKVYNNYAFIVSEQSGHGMQIFDLTRLRNVVTPQVFTVDALYTGFGNCHTIAINEATGYAYCFGTSTFSGGIHAVNIQNPENPVFSFGYSSQDYTHDGQVVIYNGPDAAHVGKEIFVGANEDKVVIVDVTNKSNPVLLSTFFYPNTSYTHQGWFTEDQRYWILGDEIDELDFGFNSRSTIIDMSDLDNPVFKADYFGPTAAIDHNGYVLGQDFYLANYTAGLRIISTENIDAGLMNEIGFFDTYPQNNSAVFNGAWSNYPYYASGSIIVSDIDRGLFILRKGAALATDDFQANAPFLMSPNPAESTVKISSGNTIELVEVFDILGKKVRSFNATPANDFSFDCSDLTSGIYIVKVNNSLVSKLVRR